MQKLEGGTRGAHSEAPGTQRGAIPAACRRCDARCCRYLCIPVETPDYFEDFDNLRWYLVHRNVTIHVAPDGQWFVRIDNRCGNLVRRGGVSVCKDYARRPLACRQLSPETCDYTVGQPDYEELFQTADQLDAYARRMLGDIEYRAGRRRTGLEGPATKRPRRAAKR